MRTQDAPSLVEASLVDASLVGASLVGASRDAALPMIHYALRCAEAHEFDGWFKSSASFDAQAAEGLLICPSCGSSTVQRALMSPRIGQGAALVLRPQDKAPGVAGATDADARGPSAQAPSATPPDHTGSPGAIAAAPPPPSAMPDQIRAVLQRIRAEVEKTCAYVGPDFARQVRRMAETGEPRRPIYGEATYDEAASLAEDGIDVARIPWVPRADG